MDHCKIFQRNKFKKKKEDKAGDPTERWAQENKENVGRRVFLHEKDELITVVQCDYHWTIKGPVRGQKVELHPEFSRGRNRKLILAWTRPILEAFQLTHSPEKRVVIILFFCFFFITNPKLPRAATGEEHKVWREVAAGAARRDGGTGGWQVQQFITKPEIIESDNWQRHKWFISLLLGS